MRIRIKKLFFKSIENISKIRRMNLAGLDLNLLVALEALLEEESVGRAARRNSLSQPAMSHALRRLRNLFGDELIVRVGGRMQRTARAESLRYPVRDALERVRQLLTGDNFDPAVSSRTFRIFVADNAVDLILAPLLKKLHETAPSVRIELHSWRANGADPVELARSVDAAVACVPDSFPSFHRQRLYTDRDMCALRSGHPLRRQLHNVERFLKAKHVAVKVHGIAEDPVDTWLRTEGRKRNIALSVPHYLQALHAVAHSDLIAVIPERLIRAYAGALRLKSAPVPLDVGTFDEYLLHPARTHAEPGCVWLRGILKEISMRLDS